MKKIFAFLRKEFKEALPPTLFFLAMFHLVAFLRSLTEESYGITPTSTAMATVGALIVGKTILIVNKLRFTNWFSQSPLAVSIVWKALIFSVFTTLFQIVEEMVPLLMKYGSLAGAVDHLLVETVWPRFWANHILGLILLLIYCSAVELIRVFGAERLKYLFFGIGTPPRRQRAAR